MISQVIIERIMEANNQLPEDKAQEISEFVDFIMKCNEEHSLTKASYILPQKVRFLIF